MTRNWRVPVSLVIAALALLALILARRAPQPIPTPAERAAPLAQGRSAAYADPGVCSTCHEEIAPTYALTGMARAFSKVRGYQVGTANRLYHAASDRYYAMVERDGVSLWLSGPGTSAAQPMPDGRKPEPGGWNRIVISVDDIASLVEELQGAGVTFRSELISGPGGQQVLIEDPDGNPIEVFQSR